LKNADEENNHTGQKRSAGDSSNIFVVRFFGQDTIINIIFILNFMGWWSWCGS